MGRTTPREVLRDMAAAMEPKPGINAPPLAALYGAALAAELRLEEETPHWRIYTRLPSPDPISRAGAAR